MQKSRPDPLRPPSSRKLTHGAAARHGDHPRDVVSSTASAPGSPNALAKHTCHAIGATRVRTSCERRAAGLQPVSLERVESAGGTPAEPVDVDAGVLGGRAGVAVVGTEQASLSREARGTLIEYRVARGPAAARQRSPGSCSKPGRGVLLNGFELAGRSWTSAGSVALAVHCA